MTHICHLSSVFCLLLSIGCLAPQQPPPMPFVGGGLAASQSFGVFSGCTLTWPVNMTYVVDNDTPPREGLFVSVAAGEQWAIHPCDGYKLVGGLIPPGVAVRFIAGATSASTMLGEVDRSLDVYQWLPGGMAPRRVGFMRRSVEVPIGPYPLRQRVHNYFDWI
jgi:hypothetical protein